MSSTRPFRLLPVMAHAVDEQGRITDVTDAWIEALGFTRDEVLGRRSFDFLTPGSMRVMRETAFPRFLETGRVEGVAMDFLACNGRVLETLLSARGELDEDGHLQSAVAVFVEVGEQRRVERELSQEKYRLQTITDALPIFISYLDKEVRYRWVNEQYLTVLGLRRDELIGRSPAEILDARSWAQERPIFDRVFAGETVNVQRTMRFADGTVRHLRVSYLPDLDRHGTIRGAHLLAHDITDWVDEVARREELQGRMQQAQRLESLGLLAGGVAHDFNNLLTGIIAGAEVLCQESSDEHREVAQDIEAAALRASDLTRQLLTYAGRQPTAVQAVDLSASVLELGTLMRAAMGSGVALEIQLSAAWVGADPAQLSQVVLNLLSNAADAIRPDKGTVTLRTGIEDVGPGGLSDAIVGGDAPAGRYGFVEVQDDGRGMPAETLQRVFEPFFSTKGAGRGLGMAAVIGIVSRHGGVLRVWSEPNVGTRVRVTLPNAPAAHSHAQACPAKTLSGRILLVDDDPFVLRACIRTLARLGVTVVGLGLRGEGRRRVVRHRRRGVRPHLVRVRGGLPRPPKQLPDLVLRRRRPRRELHVGRQLRRLGSGRADEPHPGPGQGLRVGQLEQRRGLAQPVRGLGHHPEDEPLALHTDRRHGRDGLRADHHAARRIRPARLPHHLQRSLHPVRPPAGDPGGVPRRRHEPQLLVLHRERAVHRGHGQLVDRRGGRSVPADRRARPVPAREPRPRHHRALGERLRRQRGPLPDAGDVLGALQGDRLRRHPLARLRLHDPARRVQHRAGHGRPVHGVPVPRSLRPGVRRKDGSGLDRRAGRLGAPPGAGRHRRAHG
ncbi:MAG: PAS domain-containing protein [Proteobacteria bacterium]|nr:PAS domain-containing protein [Pseudomonadota bacterium]MCP4916138.1 PAS domain-containing protein [Pseudomonadota bacterium]